MIFETICTKTLESNDITIFGKLEESDWTYHDTDYVANIDKIVFHECIDVGRVSISSALYRKRLDFDIKYLPEIGDPITVSICPEFNTFYILSWNMDFIDLNCMKLFVQETINHFMRLEKARKEINEGPLA